MKRNKFPNNKKAFTLIELLVVVAIISLLTSIVLNSLAGARMKANDAKIAQDLRQFRIAAELYYNDNHSYPPGYVATANVNGGDVAISNLDKNGWSNKLSFFTKSAEASVLPRHTLTPLCANFDVMAATMVQNKYLSTVPVHPYDNDANHVCYKAVNSATSFSAYAYLTSQIQAGGGTINKRTGFIIGDTSSSGIANLVTATRSYDSSSDPSETVYPIGADGNTPTDISTSVDSINGITSGTSNSSGGSGIISGDTSSGTGSSTPYTLVVTVLNTPGGFVITDPSKTTYNSGDSVTITAHPYTGYSLTYWMGCTSSNGNTCYVTMNSNKQVYASFNLIAP